MKIVKRLLQLLIVMIMCIGMCSIPVYAATVNQDGLDVSLSTDKEKYSLEESIVATIVVTNTNDFDVRNVSLENFIPDGYKIIENDTSKLAAYTLKSGEKISLKAIYVPVTVNVAGKTTSSSNSSATVTTYVTTDNKNGKNDNRKAGHHDTGDKRNITPIFVVIALAGGISVTMFCLKKKSRKKLMSIILCVAATRTVLSVIPTSDAAQSEYKELLVSETVTAGNKTVVIKAVVKYDMKAQDPASSANEYFQNNSKKIIDIINVKESDAVMTESEVIDMLAERGFDEYPITYEYNIGGEYIGETEVSEDSNEKHAMYQTTYESEEGDVWTIFVIGDTIVANPVSYNLDSELDAQLLVAQTDTLTSYDDTANKIYVTIPKESAVILKVAHNINADTLGKLTYEEIEKL